VGTEDFNLLALQNSSQLQDLIWAEAASGLDLEGWQVSLSSFLQDRIEGPSFRKGADVNFEIRGVNRLGVVQNLLFRTTHKIGGNQMQDFSLRHFLGRFFASLQACP
jgi:hypothetical protein